MSVVILITIYTGIHHATKALLYGPKKSSLIPWPVGKLG